MYNFGSSSHPPSSSSSPPPPHTKKKIQTAQIVTLKVNDLLIGHFTVVCLVAWPLNESEAGVDLVLTETPLLFLY